MAFKLPRGVDRAGGGAGDLYRPDKGFDFFPGDAPGAEQSGDGTSHVQDGGLHPDPGPASVQDQVYPVPQLVPDVFRPGGAEAAEGVGAGGGYRAGGKGDEFPGRRMIRQPDRHGGKPRGGQIRHRPALGEDQGQGPGPEPPAKEAGFFPGPPLQGIQVRRQFKPLKPGDVDDQGIKPGPVFDLKNPGQGSGVKPVGSKAVDGFRGKGDQQPRFERLRGQGDIGIGDRKDPHQSPLKPAPVFKEKQHPQGDEEHPPPGKGIGVGVI